MPVPKPKSKKQESPVVLITGASQGLGAAIARGFAAGVPGARLVLVARSRKNLETVARECRMLGAEAEARVCDVSRERAVAALSRSVHRRHGAVNVLVNNAGQYLAAPFLRTSLAGFDAQIAANLRSVFLVSQAFVPGMVRRRRGDVFTISSIAGVTASSRCAAYSAAKFGVTGLTRAMREELKPHGVRVCVVHPGPTWTPSWEKSGVDPERLMPAEDVAAALIAAWRLGPRTVVEEIVLRPQLGDL